MPVSIFSPYLWYMSIVQIQCAYHVSPMFMTGVLVQGPGLHVHLKSISNSRHSRFQDFPPCPPPYLFFFLISVNSSRFYSPFPSFHPNLKFAGPSEFFLLLFYSFIPLFWHLLILPQYFLPFFSFSCLWHLLILWYFHKLYKKKKAQKYTFLSISLSCYGCFLSLYAG